MMRRRIGVLAIAVGLVSALAAGAAAYSPIGSDFRISTVGTDDDEGRDGFAASIAYNPTANEYLVTWGGDGGGTDNAFEIWGQRLSATGAELETDFQISTSDGAFNPSVAYNPTADQYLVTWVGDSIALGVETEVHGQLLEGDGDEVGTDFQISLVNPAGTERVAFDPAAAYNPTANEYLVTWTADGLLATDNDFEVFGQRLEPDGDQVGTEDFRISTVEPAGAGNNANEPSVAVSPAANEYLVTWHANGNPNASEFEIYGQRLNAAGGDLGGDFQISNVEPAGAARAGINSSVAHNPTANEYLVTWSADGLAATDDEFEIFGQRLSAAGGAQGGDFQISNVEPAGAARDGREPSVAFSPNANEYLVTWEADGLAATNDEVEIFGQRLTGAGAELSGDFRISNAGMDGDTERMAEDPALAFSAAANEFLVAWEADGLLPTEDEFEIFGRRLAPAPPPVTPAVTPPVALPAAPAEKRCRKGFKPKKVKGKRKCVRKKKKKR